MPHRLPAAFLAAALVVTPALARVTLDEMFAAATSADFTAQIAGTYPARNEILVKVANGDQFALPLAPGADLSAWSTNDVVNVTLTIGGVTDISRADVSEPTVGYEVVTDDVAGLPDDAVVRAVTWSLPAERVTLADTTVTFFSPEGVEVTANLVDDVHVRPVPGEYVTISYYDAVNVGHN